MMAFDITSVGIYECIKSVWELLLNWDRECYYDEFFVLGSCDFSRLLLYYKV